MPAFTASANARHRYARLSLVASGLVALAALTGCVPAGPPASGGSETPAPTPAPSATSAPSAAADPTPAPGPAGTTVSLDCDDILTPEDLYAFNPNYGTAPDYSPDGGTPAATAVEHNGVACGWLNQTSGEIIEIGVAAPNGALMAQLKNAAATGSQAVTTFGAPPAVEGFFTVTGGAGEAQVFSGSYWVTARSAVFFEPGDAQQLVETAVSHLP